MGREAGMPVELSHFKIETRSIWGSSEKTLALVENATAARASTWWWISIRTTARARTSGSLFRAGRWPTARRSSQGAALRPGDAGAHRPRNAREAARGGPKDYSYAMVATFQPDPSYEGKTISEINATKGRAATAGRRGGDDSRPDCRGRRADGVSHDGRRRRGADPPLPEHGHRERWRRTEAGAGNPHPRSYGTNARVLAEYVRVRKVISLEDAIRRMTSLPARTFGFRDRGLLREGSGRRPRGVRSGEGAGQGDFRQAASVLRRI